MQGGYTMKDDNVISIKKPEGNFNDHLTEMLREGCRRILEKALEVEMEAFIEHCKDLKDDQGRQRVIRNGYLPEREVQTGIGQIKSSAVPAEIEAPPRLDFVLHFYLRDQGGHEA